MLVVDRPEHVPGRGAEGAFDHVSHGLYEKCRCGHNHPEHSLFGTCRGCLDCDDTVEFDEADDHVYRQCECRRFKLAEEPESGPAEGD